MRVWCCTSIAFGTWFLNKVWYVSSIGFDIWFSKRRVWYDIWGDCQINISFWWLAFSIRDPWVWSTIGSCFWHVRCFCIGRFGISTSGFRPLRSWVWQTRQSDFLTLRFWFLFGRYRSDAFDNLVSTPLHPADDRLNTAGRHPPSYGGWALMTRKILKWRPLKIIGLKASGFALGLNVRIQFWHLGFSVHATTRIWAFRDFGLNHCVRYFERWFMTSCTWQGDCWGYEAHGMVI